MKKLLSIAFCVAAVSAFGDTTVSLGHVGVTAITNTLKNTIVAVSYDDLAGGTGMVVSNFVKTTNLTTGDQLAIFNGTGTYDTWTLDEKDGVKFWAKSDVTFTVNADGNLNQGEGKSADKTTQLVGTGIWLVRQNPTDKDGKAIPFYIYGKPVANPTLETAAGVWTLIGNPNQADFTIGNDVVDKAADGDQIVIPTEPDGNLCYYTYKTGKGWRTAGSDGHWVDNAPPELGAGLGCWILTKTASTINW